jgi:Ca2+-dependent lipid-binding protein
MSQQMPEKGKYIDCPACGQTVEQRDVFTGKHTRVCKPFVQALQDAQPGSFQKKREAEMRQEDLVRKNMTFSERYADVVLQADFVRKWWLPSWLTSMLLSWLVGYGTPTYSYWFTLAMIPVISFTCMMLFFNGKVRKLFKKGPVNRV